MSPVLPQAVRDFGCELGRRFPGRIEAVYVFGSAADGTGVAASDVDVVAIFRDAFRDRDELVDARAFADDYADAVAAELELDVSLVSDEVLRGGSLPYLVNGIKADGRLVHGRDVRERLAWPDPESFRRFAAGIVYSYVRGFRARRPDATPDDPPDPTGEFLGYDWNSSRRHDPRAAAGIRDLVSMNGWIATTRLAAERGVVVTSKSRVVADYCRELGDEWASHLQAVFTAARTRWNYQVPDDPASRRQLAGLCERTHAFERFFLERFPPPPASGV